MILLALVAAAAAVLAEAAAPVAERPRQESVNPRAAALAEFQQRLKGYLELRNEVKKREPAPKPTEDPNDLVGRQERLARAIAAERKGAKPGDVFGTDVPPMLKKAIAEDLRRRSVAERAAAFQEVPKNLRLGVNDTYPKSIPLATVPPRLLAALPQLPDGLEYRFVGQRLVLLDTTANLVVDILHGAVPAR